MRTVKTRYIEPADYFPEEIRKAYKLGEYHESEKKDAEEAEIKPPEKQVPKP